MWMFVNIECSYRTAIWMFLLIQYIAVIWHSHQLLLYRVDFERPVSLKQGVISSNLLKIGYDFGVRTASGAQDYEISPKIGCVFRARTASGTPDYEIFPKTGYVFGVWTALGAWGCEISLK